MGGVIGFAAREPRPLWPADCGHCATHHWRQDFRPKRAIYAASMQQS